MHRMVKLTSQTPHPQTPIQQPPPPPPTPTPNPRRRKRSKNDRKRASSSADSCTNATPSTASPSFVPSAYSNHSNRSPGAGTTQGTTQALVIPPAHGQQIRASISISTGTPTTHTHSLELLGTAERGSGHEARDTRHETRGTRHGARDTGKGHGS